MIDQTIQKLTPAMVDLLVAISNGVELHLMYGVHPYFFRSDNLQRCSKQATALEVRGLIVRQDEYGRKPLVLTAIGRVAVERLKMGGSDAK